MGIVILTALLKAIATREAKRNNATYRPHGLTALGGIAQARNDLDFMPDALSIVSGVLEEVLGDEDEGDKMDIDSGNGHKSKYVYRPYQKQTKRPRLINSLGIVWGKR